MRGLVLPRSSRWILKLSIVMTGVVMRLMRMWDKIGD